MDGLWMEHTIKMDDLGYPYFRKASYAKMVIYHDLPIEDGDFPWPRSIAGGYMSRLGVIANIICKEYLLE